MADDLLENEGDLMRRIMKSVSRTGARVSRNNCGVAQYGNGVSVKYGLFNPGGADIIGFVPITITPEMVGQKACIFVAMEVKTIHGRPSDHQKNFLATVKNAGGIAGIVRNESDALALLEPSRPRTD